jgi:N-acetylneuraminate synthase
MFLQKNIEDFVVDPTDTVYTAMQKIDRNKHRVVIVVLNNQVLGTVSDGDVRRAFLHNAIRITPVSSIMNINCKTTSEPDPELGKTILKKEMVTVLPVTDNKNRLIGLHTAYEPEF